MQCACALLYCHLWPAALYRIFPHYLINGKTFEKKLLKTKCVFWFSLQIFSETFLVLRKSERDMIKKMWSGWFPRKVQVILVRYKWNSNFSTDVRKSLKYQISWKSVQWDPSLFNADERTEGADGQKLRS